MQFYQCTERVKYTESHTHTHTKGVRGITALTLKACQKGELKDEVSSTFFLLRICLRIASSCPSFVVVTPPPDLNP